MNHWKYYHPNFEYFSQSKDKTRAWIGHVNFAYDLLSNVKPEIVVELGTHNGTSFFSMCQAIKDNKLATKIYAVDTWKGDPHASQYDEAVFEGVNGIVKEYYSEIRPTLLRKTFNEALSGFQDESIDILHIDGYHTYEAVKHDFETWAGKMKKNGIILFHDTHEKREGFGVHVFWDELKNKYVTMEFEHSHGLGVLFKNIHGYEDLLKKQQEWCLYYSEKAKDSEKKMTFFEREEMINQQKNEILELKNDVKTLQSSKFRKLQNFYMRIKQFVTGK